MATMLETRPADRFLTRFADWFDMPDMFRFLDRPTWTSHLRIEEERRDNEIVVRAEMPGIDPEKDVEIELADGLLTIRAERREEERSEDDGKVVSEFRYGRFMRTVAVPREVKAEDVKAMYRDGILEVTVPVPEPATVAAATKVPVSRS